MTNIDFKAAVFTLRIVEDCGGQKSTRIQQFAIYSSYLSAIYVHIMYTLSRGLIIGIVEQRSNYDNLFGVLSLDNPTLSSITHAIISVQYLKSQYPILLLSLGLMIKSLGVNIQYSKLPGQVAGQVTPRPATFYVGFSHDAMFFVTFPPSSRYFNVLWMHC